MSYFKYSLKVGSVCVEWKTTLPPLLSQHTSTFTKSAFPAEPSVHKLNFFAQIDTSDSNYAYIRLMIRIRITGIVLCSVIATENAMEWIL